MFNHLLAITTLTALSSAHFILLWPPTAGFSDATLSKYPCGGFTPTVNSSTPDVQVDQFAVSIQNTHPVGDWSFRGTLNTEAPYTFTDIVPIVNTNGIGTFCLDHMLVPSNWAGQLGIIQVIDRSDDGMLYQCAAVNFVSGSNITAGPACSNATNVQASWASTGSGSGSMNPASSSVSATATAASSSSSGGAAVATGMGSLIGGLGLLAAGLAL